MEGPSASASADSNQYEAVDVHAPFTTAERMQQLNEIDLNIITLLEHTSAAMRSIAQAPTELVSAAATATTAAADNSDPTSTSVVQPPPLSSTSFDPTAPMSQAAQQYGAIQQAFFATLDRVDKQLKRQIWALEEAGIVTLGKSASGAGAGDPLPSQSQPQSQSQQAIVAALFPSQWPAAGGAVAQSGAGDGAGLVPPAVAPPLEPDGMGRYGGLDVGRLNAAGRDTVLREMERELWARARAHITAQTGDRMEE